MGSETLLAGLLQRLKVLLRYGPMKVVAYLRVSTIGQAKDGLCLPTQERMVRQWARAAGHRLVAIIPENGKSGALPETERPGLLEALSVIRRGDAQALVVTSLDRLARSLHVQEAVLGSVWAMGGQVFTVDAGEVLRDDPDDPMRTAMRQMAGVFAELDRRMIVKRLRNGRQTKAEAGGYAGGGVPYGWKVKDGELVEDKDEQGVITYIRTMHEGAHESLASIAKRLNNDGIRPRQGRWHPAMIARILARSDRPED